MTENNSGELRSFFNADHLRRCAVHGFSYSNLDRKKPVYLGIDMGGEDRLGAIAAVQVDRGNSHDVAMISAVFRCFLPLSPEGEGDYRASLHPQYQAALESDSDELLFMKAKSKSSLLFDEARRILSSYDSQIGLDAFCAGHFLTHLKYHVGSISEIPVWEHSQTGRTFTQPLRLLREAITCGSFRWSGSDLMLWQLTNLCAEDREDTPDDLLTVSRKHGDTPSAGITALLNALATFYSAEKVNGKTE